VYIENGVTTWSIFNVASRQEDTIATSLVKLWREERGHIGWVVIAATAGDNCSGDIEVELAVLNRGSVYFGRVEAVGRILKAAGCVGEVEVKGFASGVEVPYEPLRFFDSALHARGVIVHGACDN